jgi:hypothetical protein
MPPLLFLLLGDFLSMYYTAAKKPEILDLRFISSSTLLHPCLFQQQNMHRNGNGKTNLVKWFAYCFFPK